MGLGSPVSNRSKGWGPSTGPGLGVHRKWVWGLRGVTKCYGVLGWEVWGPGCPIGATGPSTGPGLGVSEMGLGSSVSYRGKGWGGTPGFGVPRKWVWGLGRVRKRFGVPGLGVLGSYGVRRFGVSQVPDQGVLGVPRLRIWGPRVGVFGVPRGESPPPPPGPEGSLWGSQGWGSWGQEVWGLVTPRSGAPGGPRLGGLGVPCDEVPPPGPEGSGLRFWGPMGSGGLVSRTSQIKESWGSQG